MEYTGYQLLTSLPHPLRSGARGFEEHRLPRDLQGGLFSRRREEKHQKTLGGPIREWKEQVVLPSLKGAYYYISLLWSRTLICFVAFSSEHHAALPYLHFVLNRGAFYVSDVSMTHASYSRQSYLMKQP